VVLQEHVQVAIAFSKTLKQNVSGGLVGVAITIDIHLTMQYRHFWAIDRSGVVIRSGILATRLLK
jgi:hypothetical protein